MSREIPKGLSGSLRGLRGVSVCLKEFQVAKGRFTRSQGVSGGLQEVSWTLQGLCL